MSKISNIDLVYEFLKAKNDSVKFNEIWKVVDEKSTQEHFDKNAVMASLYSALVCDNRFSLTPDGAWALRNNPKFEDVKKQYDSLETSSTKKFKDFEEELTTSIDDDELFDEDYQLDDDDEFDDFIEDEKEFGSGDIIED